jgi:hypothetical protein
MKFYLASKFLPSLGLVIVFIFLVKGNLKNISLERVKEKKLGSRREASYIKKNQSIFKVWPGGVGLGPQSMLLSRSHLMFESSRC